MKDYNYFHTLFIETAYEYLDQMDNALSELSGNFGNKEAVNTIYISAHSVKSQSIAMNYELTAHLALGVERLLKKIKDEQIHITKELLDVITESVQKIRESINKIKAENKEIDLARDIEKLNHYGA